MRRGWWCLLLCLMACTVASAQTTDPVGPFVVDVRGLMAGLPSTAGWVPDGLPTGTEVPSRGFGLEGGGHVYMGRLGVARLGVGGAFGLARGTAQSPAAGTPEVVGRVTTLAPQFSLNFGHRLGWSYLSGGYGGTRFDSESTALTGVDAGRVESGWTGTINVGGGARWFLNEHVGVSFDARWHLVSSPRTTLFHLAVGLSLQ